MVDIISKSGRWVVIDSDYPKNKGYIAQSKSDALRFAEIHAQVSGMTWNDRFDLMIELNSKLYPSKRRRVKKKPNK